MRAALFLRAWHARNERDRAARAASLAFNAIAGVGMGRMGLTPDAVKAGPEWRGAHARYQAAASALRDANATLNRAFPREMRAARRMGRARIA